MEDTGDDGIVVDEVFWVPLEVYEDRVDGPSIFEDAEDVARDNETVDPVPAKVVERKTVDCVLDGTERVLSVDDDGLSEFSEIRDEAVDAMLDGAVFFSDAVLELAYVDVDFAVRFVEMAESLVVIDAVLGGTLDVASLELDAFSPPDEVADGTVDNEFVLEDDEGVGSVDIRVIPSRDSTSKTILSAREGELACGTDASKWDTEEELSAHRRSNLRLGV